MNAKTGSSGRIFGLDLMRAIAVCMVVVSHSTGMLQPALNMPGLGPILGKLLALTLPFGVLGVEMFFALSGFLIGNILIREYMKGSVFNSSSLFRFWRNRWFRTLPAYLVALSLVFLLNLFVYHVPNDFRYVFFLQNLVTPHPDFFGEAWSLSIEEWFYLSLPLTLFCANNYVRKEPRRLLKVFVAYISVILLIRTGYVLSNDVLAPDKFLRKPVIFRLDSILYGVLIAFLFQYKKEALFRRKKGLFLTGIALVLLFTGLNYLSFHPSFNLFDRFFPYRTLMNLVFYSALPFGFALCLPFMYDLKAPSGAFLLRIITRISLISYSMYLIHSYIIYMVLIKFVKFETPLAALSGYLLYWLLVVGAAYLLYKAVEQPFLRLRNRLN